MPLQIQGDPNRMVRSRRSLRADPAHLDSSADDDLQSELVTAISHAAAPSDAMTAIAKIICKRLPGAQLAVFHRLADNSLSLDTKSDLLVHLPQAASESLISLCKQTSSTGKTESTVISGEKIWTLVAAPVVRQSLAPDVMVLVYAVLACDAPSVAMSRLTSLLQMASSHFAMWQLIRTANQTKQQLSHSAAITELATKVVAAGKSHLAASIIASGLKTHLRVDRVSIGLCKPGRVDCQWIVDSEVSTVDRRGNVGRFIESAMRESAIRKEVAILDRKDPSSFSGDTLVAHRQWMDHSGDEFLSTTPLLSADDEVIAVIVISSRKTTSGNADRSFLLGMQHPIGAAMASTMLGSPVVRRARGVSRRFKGYNFVLAGLALMIAAAVLAIPMPYRVACDCVLEPSVRRYIAAPYEGRLEGSMIRPGDVVTTGQPLALMDSRELNWELSGLEADYRSEQKNRDAASARDEIAVAQQSGLEMQRLEIKMKLIRHRLDHLEIKSPIDGVVLSGDLSRSEGAPMTMGQTLLEIAPLDHMVVEVAIPESEIRQVDTGMSAEFRLDSDAQFRGVGKIIRIHPRPEIRQGQSVFIAEVDVDNRDHSLRPGTKGIARIETQSHSIAWNWTHKAWDAVSMNWGL
jgi:hypothetical protein